MIIISVIFILAMSLSGMAISTRMQFNKSDDRNKATDLAEMGITYYQTVVNKFISSANAAANELVKNNNGNFDTYFRTELERRLTSQPTINNTVENSNNYKIQYDNLVLSSGEFMINFVSTGSTGNNSISLTGTILIQKSSAIPSKVGQTTPSPSSYQLAVNAPIILEAKNKIAQYNASTYFSETIHIQGNRSLIVKGDAFFSKELTFQGSANITINGDAIFLKPIIFPNGTPYTFCVYGNTYKVDGNDKLVAYPITQNKCSKPPTQNWDIDTSSGTNVQY
jgi:hypothetical protein